MITKSAAKQGSCRARAGGGAGLWIGSLALLGGCRAISSSGLTDCYAFVRGELEVDGRQYRVKGMGAKQRDPDCPRIRKVRCELWEDLDGDGVRDPNERLLNAEETTSNPPSSAVLIASMNGVPSTIVRKTAWRCEVTNEHEQLTTWGGTF